MSKKKIQYKDYADYLKSEKWKQVKNEYRQKEDAQECLCCGNEFQDDINPNYHHFRYPKDWNDDTYENLITVCVSCHEHLHASIDHNSDPITLREYMPKLIYVSSQIIENEVLDLEYDTIWHECKGEFSIKQLGVSTKKQMKAEFITTNRRLINFFEDKRDKILSNGDVDV